MSPPAVSTPKPSYVPEIVSARQPDFASKSEAAAPNTSPPVDESKRLSPNADVPLSTPPVQTPVEVAGPVPDSEQLLNLAEADAARRTQRRLVETGFLTGVIDGVWGARSRQALQDFRFAQGMADNASWDFETQQRLFSDTAVRGPVVPFFVGGWAADPDQCQQTQDRKAPLIINRRRAEAFGAVCEFIAMQRESLSAWRVQATCTHDNDRWNANIRLTLVGTKLNWSSERGPATYVRCPPS